MAKLAIEESRRRGGHAAGAKKRRNKLGNEKVDGFLADGTPHRFDSKHEYERYGELALMERAGEISGLRLQVPFECIPAVKDENGKTIERAVRYIADFAYKKDGKWVIEDVKGYRNPSSAPYRVFVLKRKILRYFHGIEVREV